MQLEETIEKIKVKSRADDATAVQDALELTALHPKDATVWSLLAFVHARSGHHEEAIADLDQAINIESKEPVMYFNRGRYKGILGRYTESIGDYTQGLVLCDLHNNDYYREPLHFLRAHAYLQLGDKKSA